MLIHIGGYRLIEFLTTYTLEEIAVFSVLLGGALIGLWKALSYVNEELELIITKKMKNRQIEKRLMEVEHQLCILLESDKSRIRGEIVREYRHFIRQNYIDAFSLDYLHQQYESYKTLKGNSYISQLMSDLDALPLAELSKPEQGK